MKTIDEVIKKAIDIHVHIGPEIIPRKYTVSQIVSAEGGRIGGMVLKNHFYPTAPLISSTKSLKKLMLFGGIALNNASGGLNSDAIKASSYVSSLPIVVWLPTINAKNFLAKSKYEIAPEWVQREGFMAAQSQDVKPVNILRNGKLSKELLEVLKTIKECNAVLATGHISWKESVTVADEAIKLGLKNILITHPIYQKIDMPIKIQEQLAQKGCFIEQSFSMYSIDKIPIRKIAGQIKKVGSKSVILSSDVGQSFSPSPSRALKIFAKLLLKEGISIDELFTMLVVNPKKLLKID